MNSKKANKRKGFSIKRWRTYRWMVFKYGTARDRAIYILFMPNPLFKWLSK